jgi:N-acetylglucosaminyl-diphospho-decaprenol L-rhamnosyltransferase
MVRKMNQNPIQTPLGTGLCKPMKPVTVSVVSHDQMALVAQLLHDLNRHCQGVVERIVLTHNLPGEARAGAMAGDMALTEIDNARPLGFGCNHNGAFRHCETEWFLVINPDVRLGADVISPLLRRRQPRTGLLAPQETDCAGAPHDHPRGLITPREVLARQMGRPSVAPPRRHGWVKGMFMLMPAEVFRAVGGFDERYGLYCEDFDLCARLMLHGWSVDHHADLTVEHHWQRNSRRSWLHLRRHLASLLRMWTSGVFWRYRRLLREGAPPRLG